MLAENKQDRQVYCMEKEIADYLDKLCFLHSLKGYQYILEMIEMGLQDRSSLSRMGDVYVLVAGKFGVTWRSVERAVRISIAASGAENQKTKEFIFRAVDWIAQKALEEADERL